MLCLRDCKTMKKIFITAIALAALSYGFFKQGEIQSASDNYSNIYVTPNYRIYPSSVAQSEPEIIRHPANPNILFASSFTINSAFKSEGVYITTNGGESWFGSDTCKGALITNHGGDPGPAIDKDGRFFMAHIGGFQTGQFAHYSTNLGTTWSNQYPIVVGDVGKGDIRSDGSSLSPYYGKTYLAWVQFTSPFPVMLSATTNGGVNWSSAFQVNNPSQRCQGALVRMNAEGHLYVSWAGVISSSPFTEDYFGFAKSTNGGASFTVTENAFDMNGISGTLPQKSNILVNGLPDLEVDMSNGPRHGWIYVVTGEKKQSAGRLGSRCSISPFNRWRCNLVSRNKSKSGCIEQW